MKSFVFIVADAGTQTEGDWVKTLSGPKFPQMVSAISNAGIRSSVRDEFDALTLSIEIWRSQLVAWRCGLPGEVVRKYRGTLSGWDCADVDLIVEDVGFDDFPPAERARLNDIETRLKLPAAQVDLLISAGIASVRSNVRLQQAFGDVQRRAGVAPRSASLE
jgi:hypothetical protein